MEPISIEYCRHAHVCAVTWSAKASKEPQLVLCPLRTRTDNMEGGGEEYTEAPNGNQQYTEDQSAYDQPGYEQQQDSGVSETAISNPGDRINASKNDDDER